MSKYTKILLSVMVFAISLSGYAKLFTINIINNTNANPDGLTLNTGQFDNATYNFLTSTIWHGVNHGAGVINGPAVDTQSTSFINVFDSNLTNWGCYFSVVVSPDSLADPEAFNMNGDPKGVQCSAKIHGDQVTYTISNPSKK